MKTENRMLVKACVEKIGSDSDKVSQLFYKHLFQLDMQLKTVFSGNVAFLNRKFTNMLATFKNIKHLETISDSVVKMGERHAQYGTLLEHFPTVKQALLSALADYFGEKFTAVLKNAWSDVFDDVAQLMKQGLAAAPENVNPIAAKTDTEDNLYAQIGGEEIILRVHKRFYDVMFDEPWLEKFFFGKSKEALILKQTQFMVAAFNGANHYRGDTPAFVHMHMFITEEMLDVRERILREAILAEGISAELTERWLSVDRSFRAAIVKHSVDECVMKCKGQLPIVAKKPLGYKVIR
jgi:hemoglobin